MTTKKKVGRPPSRNPENTQISFKVSQEIVDALEEYARQLQSCKGSTRQYVSKGIAAKSVILDWYYGRFEAEKCTTAN
jgi:hypothetical protein